MKAKIFFPFFIFFLFATSCKQTNQTSQTDPADYAELNLDFEVVENGIPQGWKFRTSSNYSVYLDSTGVISGKFALVIECTGDTANNRSSSFQTIGLELPHNYDGEKITLSGYIKTENVENYAAVAIMTFPTVVSNLSEKVSGTTDWEKYEVTLDLHPETTEQIVIGASLSGKGKMWLDDLQITIDGVDIKEANIYEKKTLPSMLEQTFCSSSNIIIPFSKNPTSQEDKTLITNLELMGRVWGFLKYYHPEVGKGKYDWDDELFCILPEYLQAVDTKQRDEILLRWIEKYGKIPECKTCMITMPNAVLKPDLSWVEYFDMNVTLKEKIMDIYQNRYQGSHYYVEPHSLVGCPVFLNEKPYSHSRIPDAGIRLLALYRYWNMIQYFYPYKHLTDKNWNDVLKEYIPKLVLAETELEYQLAVLKLTGEICDSHASLTGGYKIDSIRGSWHAPFQVRFAENRLTVTDYPKPELQESAGLKKGDIITHVNGITIESIIDSIKPYYPASNEATRLSYLANDLLRSTNSTITIDYISADKGQQKTELTLYKKTSLNTYKRNNSPKYQLLLYDNLLVRKDVIGYINLKFLTNSDIDEIKKTFKNTKGIIIDLRNYPSNSNVPYLLGSFFVSENTPFVKFSKANFNNPGEFRFQQGTDILKSEDPYKGILVVIVNEETISQAEFTAMAFHAGDNTTIIGSQTRGADGNVTPIVLPGGLKTKMTGIGIYYPDGRETQRIGIVPDIEVKPTIQGIREGRDELLERAKEFIEKK